MLLDFTACWDLCTPNIFTTRASSRRNWTSSPDWLITLTSQPVFFCYLVAVFSRTWAWCYRHLAVFSRTAKLKKKVVTSCILQCSLQAIMHIIMLIISDGTDNTTSKLVSSDKVQNEEIPLYKPWRQNVDASQLISTDLFFRKYCFHFFVLTQLLRSSIGTGISSSCPVLTDLL